MAAGKVRLICMHAHTGAMVEYVRDLPVTIGRSAESNTIASLLLVRASPITLSMRQG